MVEAAVVLPLLFLAVISLIYIGIFAQNAFVRQVEVQRGILGEANESNAVFSIVSDDADFSYISGGLFRGVFTKHYSQSVYVFDEEIIIRGRKLIEGFGGEQ